MKVAEINSNKGTHFRGKQAEKYRLLNIFGYDTVYTFSFSAFSMIVLFRRAWPGMGCDKVQLCKIMIFY